MNKEGKYKCEGIKLSTSSVLLRVQCTAMRAELAQVERGAEVGGSLASLQVSHSAMHFLSAGMRSKLTIYPAAAAWHCHLPDHTPKKLQKQISTWSKYGT